MIFLLLVGFLAILVGGIMMVMAAFRVHWGWGLACVLLPFAMLLFLVVRWEQAKEGFYYQLFGTAMIILACFDFGTSRWDYERHFSVFGARENEVRELLGIQPKKEPRKQPEWQAIDPLNNRSGTSDLGGGIHKCVDADGHLTYTSEPCKDGLTAVGASNAHSPQAGDLGNGVVNPDVVPDDAAADVTHQASIKPSTHFECDQSRIYCNQMTSCDEALFYIKNCPGTMMDNDHDGIPCEKEWCGSQFLPMH